MKPGLALLARGDAAGAYAAMWPARRAFPKDLRVLRASAQAAFYSGRNKEALDLFDRALAAHPNQPWPLRLAQMQVQARLGRWEEFDRELEGLKAAKRGGADPQLEGSSGFLVDGFAAGAAGAQVSVQTVVFPLQADAYHTLYRFLLPKGSPAMTTVMAGLNNGAGLNSDAGAADDERCKNPEFRPYIDLESDDSDQESFKASHPEEAAHGGRAYSLDTYPGPCSQGLIKFYSKGEPTYEEVRGDVVKALAGTARGGESVPAVPAVPTAPVEPPAVAVPVDPAAPSEPGSPVEPTQPVAPGAETAPAAPGTEVTPQAAEPVAPESPAKPPPQD